MHSIYRDDEDRVVVVIDKRITWSPTLGPNDLAEIRKARFSTINHRHKGVGSKLLTFCSLSAWSLRA